MCVCVVFPFILDVRLVDGPAGVTQEEGSHIISHAPSFCGACNIFSREKYSAVPFPRRPSSRIMCTNELIVFHLLFGIIFLFIVRKNHSSCASTGIRTQVPR